MREPVRFADQGLSRKRLMTMGGVERSMSLGERLESLRGNRSLGDFAKLFGIHKNTYANYIKQKSVPDSGFILAVCQKFDLSANWLLMGIGPKFLDQRIHQEMPQTSRGGKGQVLVPLIETFVIDREGDIIHDGIIDHLPLPWDWIDCGDGEGEEDLTKSFLFLRVRGDSMSPTVHRGDIVLVDTRREKRTFVQTGSIFYVRLPDGERAFKRVAVFQKEGEHKVLFYSDNVTAYPPVEFTVQAMDHLHCHLLGLVRWSYRRF